MGVPTYIISKSNVNFSYRSREYRVATGEYELTRHLKLPPLWVKRFDTSQRFNNLCTPQQGHKMLCQLLLSNDVLMGKRPS